MNLGSHFLLPVFASIALIGYSQTTPVLMVQKDTIHLTLTDVWQQTDVQSKQALLHTKAQQISRENTKDAEMGRYPVFNGIAKVEQASNIPVYSDGIFNKPEQHDVIHKLYHTGVSMYLNLYSGNRQNLEIAARKTEEQKTAIIAELSQSEVRLEAAKCYLTLAKVLRFRTVIQHDIADQQEQLAEVEKLYEHGVILKSDVLRATMEVSKREMTLVQIENDILIENQKLVLLLGRKDSDFIKPEAYSTAAMPLEPYEEALEIASIHAHKQLLSTTDLALSAIEQKKVKAQNKPSIGLIGNFTMANPQIFLYPYNPSWYSLGTIGVQVSIPISSLYHNTHKVRSRALEHEKEEIQHHYVQDQIKQEVKEAYLRYTESLVQIEVCTKNSAQAAENARIIKQTYFNKLALLTDLLDANLQHLQTQFELEAAKLDSLYKYYTLQQVKGLL
ncbi:TolC family protein [Myroides odoratus]|uniref:Type I secretion outer membrane protein, TolC family n=1 Tax=Myroides odoratus TaxID=256 RepID=A0A378RP58_MYROD|nr:TolC family protein [Myroides odoratus]QQU05081.1 TolC family protein [Myroides odoratus]STZ27440.1 type I secretion outer membrane protein, TolC family [Myroides odoratus]